MPRLPQQLCTVLSPIPRPASCSRLARRFADGFPSPLPPSQLQLELREVAGREALRRALLAMVPHQIDELQKKRELMKQQQQAQQRQQAQP